MPTVLYTRYPCNGGLQQEVLLIGSDSGKSYGLASCPRNEVFFTVPVDKDFRDFLYQNEATVVDHPNINAVNNLVRVIESGEAAISPELVSMALGR